MIFSWGDVCVKFCWFQKFNFDCFLLKLLICSPKTENIFKFVCVSLIDSVIYHDFRDLFNFHHFFGLESQIMTLSQTIWKSDFWGHCSFTQLFHVVGKLRQKPKIFMKVIKRFWYVSHEGLIFLKKQPKLELQ